MLEMVRIRETRVDILRALKGAKVILINLLRYVKQKIKQYKGSIKAPHCRFSARAAEVLNGRDILVQIEARGELQKIVDCNDCEYP